MAHLRITPLHPSLGAEVAGVDLAAPIDLLDRMIRPEIVYHHAWRKGDVLIIDDRATMHRAHGDYDRSQSRVLWRIIVEGDRPRLV
jgi:taurine dioxygenase